MSAPASPEPATGFPRGMAELAGDYDGLLLDQWGVLHDGASPYPAARDCLARLKQAGKAIVILSNSGKSGAENEAGLARLGFGRALYDRIVSAGDDARAALLEREGSGYGALGRRCLLLTRPGEGRLAEGLGLEPVEDPAEADFVLAMSMDSERQSVAGWRGLLERAARRGLPFICANPDRYRVHPDGSLHEAPGLVARAYEEMGGRVHYHGKPQPRIYRTCMAALGLPAARILAVGDSLEHDIAGAAGAGLDSVFIAGGIHSSEIARDRDGEPERASCRDLFRREGLWPSHCLPSFRW